MVATPGAKIMQATRSVCAPMLGLSIFSPPLYGVEWAENCIRFNQNVLITIASMPSVKVVVLATNNNFLDGSVLIQEGDRLLKTAASIEMASMYLRGTVRALRNAGKRVVVVEPPPNQGFDIGRCIERRSSGKFYFGAADNCKILVSDYESRFEKTFQFSRRVNNDGYVKIFSFRSALCNIEFCETKLGDKIIYRDSGHLSYEGSIELAKKIALVAELERLAW